MKIEKLTENKIRVIMNLKDIESNTDIHTFFNNMINSQNIFLDILDKAEKEVNFHTEGCKLLIEAFSTLEDTIVFTITKFSISETPQNKNKKLIVKRKNLTPSFENAIYNFNDFNFFCNFCKSINMIKNLDINKIAKKIILYSYKNKYYLVFKNINYNYIYTHKVLNILSEFGKLENCSNNFEYKLIEHGKIFVKNNALIKGTKYLV